MSGGLGLPSRSAFSAPRRAIVPSFVLLKQGRRRLDTSLTETQRTPGKRGRISGIVFLISSAVTLLPVTSQSPCHSRDIPLSTRGTKGAALQPVFRLLMFVNIRQIKLMTLKLHNVGGKALRSGTFYSVLRRQMKGAIGCCRVEFR